MQALTSAAASGKPAASRRGPRLDKRPKVSFGELMLRSPSAFSIRVKVRVRVRVRVSVRVRVRYRVSVRVRVRVTVSCNGCL